MASFSAALKLKEQLSRQMLKKKGVHGIGVGLNNPRNPKSGAAVIVYTDKAFTAHTNKKLHMTVTTKGKKLAVPVIYKKTSRFRLHAKATEDLTGRIRPVVAGYSVGTPNVSGTAGLIVRSRSGNQKYILSNNHVLNATNSSKYSVTIQPGGADGGTSPKDRVGHLDRFVKISSTRPNFMDAATSIPTRNSLLSPTYAQIGVIPGYVTSYRVGDKFKKVGRTTGLVNGTVDSIHTDVQISYEGYADLSVVTFKDQTVVKGSSPVSLPGDSGSVWLTRQGNYAAAVNYAGSSDGRLSIAYPIRWFMQRFSTEVARPSGTGTVKTIKIPAKDKNKYIRSLTAEQLKQIKLVRAKRK
ncbi:hypothetical protein [Paenibacillus tuaregi]|uniref:hypothetical protein n=1 Tax=Paenibacillus tuaregi TaxID=1816681 RepID=UPI0008398072|nr:hypothetical protein [Paenibacillus tuaregi]